MEEKNGVQVSLLDPATGKLEPSEKIQYSTPEAREFWTPVLKEIRDRMEKRGLLDATMFGMYMDWTWPNEPALAIVNGVFPGAKWVGVTHPAQGASYRRIPNGYNAAAYAGYFPAPQPWDAKRKTGWQTEQKNGVFPRWTSGRMSSLKINSHAALYRIYPEAMQLSGLDGLGHTGADFWQVLEPPKDGRNWQSHGWSNKHTASICSRFPATDWNQLGMDNGLEELFAPGPQGAISTARFENFREGVQECEARIFIEKAIVGGKLDTALAQKCKDVLDERQHLLRTACVPQGWGGAMGGFQWYAGIGSEGLAEKLFTAAAEVAAKTGAK